ncbi:isoprenylcysteine carboxylmethyltransferase family protein [bacterium]|nr:isoprenylcysteine carboxylmethyltransferase family protein [bacterium]
MKGVNPIGRRETSQNMFGSISIILSTLLLLLLWIYYIIDSNISNCLFPVKILNNTVFIKWAALVIIYGATTIEIIAGTSLGDSMRIHSPYEETKLMTKGIYHFIRNPVVLGMFLYSLGIFLFIPNVLGLFTMIILIYGYNFKVDTEARDLYRRFGNDWLEYCRNVGKYFPTFKKYDCGGGSSGTSDAPCRSSREST